MRVLHHLRSNWLCYVDFNFTDQNLQSVPFLVSVPLLGQIRYGNMEMMRSSRYYPAAVAEIVRARLRGSILLCRYDTALVQWLISVIGPLNQLVGGNGGKPRVDSCIITRHVLGSLLLREKCSTIVSPPGTRVIGGGGALGWVIEVGGFREGMWRLGTKRESGGVEWDEVACLEMVMLLGLNASYCSYKKRSKSLHSTP